MRRTNFTMWIMSMLLLVSTMVHAANVEVPQAEWEKMKAEIEALRKERAPAAKPTAVDKVMDQYGSGAPVTTKVGKLTMGGLMQVWYYGFQRDAQGLFSNPANGVADTNAVTDVSGTRIRRMELTFNMDVHENITAFVKIDPAKEAASYPCLTDNQINSGYAFKTVNNVSAQSQTIIGSTKPDGFGSTKMVSNVQSGAGSTPALLEVAYIKYHGVIPHHDFTVGQFVPYFGEEARRDNGDLDFIERSFLGLLDSRYAAGVAAHGSWWDERFQYWVSAYDGPGDFFGTAGNSANRADDNNSKDVGFRGMVRPIWNSEQLGGLELGGGTVFGQHGSSETAFPLSAPEDNLNRTKTWAFNNSAWLNYKVGSGSCVRGLWVRGEYKIVRDRFAPGSIADLDGNGTYAKSLFTQENGRPISVQGFYAAMGYRLNDSVFRDSCPSCLKSFEFAGRYQQFQNVLIANPVDSSSTLAFNTKVLTAGVNYYIKGNFAKIQANYNWVYDPTFNTPNVAFHNLRNDSFALSFQVAF